MEQISPARCSRRGMAGVRIVALIVVAAAIAAGWYYRGGSGSDAIDLETAKTCHVERGDLTVTVLQAGELQAKESNAIINETETNAKVIEIVEDGVHVKKGDILLQLDAADLEDRILSQKTSLASAEANYTEAVEKRKIDQAKYKTDLDSTSLTVRLAELDLEKYVDAQYPQQVLEAEMSLALAEKELIQTSATLESTRRLVEKEFASLRELETATLDLQRKTNVVKSRATDLDILKNYTHQKDLKQKQNNLSQAVADLDRLIKTHAAEEASAEVNLASKKTSLEISQKKLDRLQEQLDKATVISEYDGLVFYPKMGGRGGGQQEIEEGATVHPRQRILEFPDLSAWEITVGVPESIFKKIQPGHRAVATIDSLPGKFIDAVVEKIGIVPDRQRWFDANSKVYTVTLDVPETPDLELRPGMSVMVEIITQEIKDTLYVPVQAVRAEGDQRYVYLVESGHTRRANVEVGDHNDDSITILSGLAEGQELLLYPPAAGEGQRPGMKERPLEKLEKNGNGRPSPTAKADGADAETQPQTQGRPEGPSADDREKAAERKAEMEKRLKDMSPEDRKKFMQEQRRKGEGRQPGASGAPAPAAR